MKAFVFFQHGSIILYISNHYIQVSHDVALIVSVIIIGLDVEDLHIKKLLQGI